jgi:hypothetical protein
MASFLSQSLHIAVLDFDRRSRVGANNVDKAGAI